MEAKHPEDEKMGDTLIENNIDTQKLPEEIKLEETKENWCTLESKNNNCDSIQIFQDSFSIGRNPTNNKMIQDTKISGKHCEISRNKQENDEYKYFIEDLSSNGTFCNNTRIGKGNKIEIKSGDEICVLRTDKESDESIIFLL